MPVNFIDKLDKFEKEFKENQGKVGELSKRNDFLFKEIQGLKKIKNAIEQVTNIYISSYNKISKNREDIKGYLEMKSKMFGDGGFKKKDEVKKIKDDYEGEVSKIKDYVKDKKEKYQEQEDKHESIRKEVEEKQEAYDNLSNYHNSVAKQLQVLNTLRERIEKEEKSKKLPNMYFLIEESIDILNRTKIMSKSNFEKKIKESRNDLDKAKQALKEKKEELDAARNELAREQEKLEALKKNRVEKILEKTSGL